MRYLAAKLAMAPASVVISAAIVAIHCASSPRFSPASCAVSSFRAAFHAPRTGAASKRSRKAGSRDPTSSQGRDRFNQQRHRSSDVRHDRLGTRRGHSVYRL